MRTWRRHLPALAAASVILGLATGAAITVFSAVRGYVLKPLPFADADRLATLWEIDPALPGVWRGAAPGNFVDWRTERTSFESVVAGVNRSFTLTSFEDSETPLMREVSEGYFETLGLRPTLGRTFSAEESRAGAAPVVMLSYELWQRRFAGSAAVIGSSTGIDGVPHTIVGVAPREYSNPIFLLDVQPQAFLPLRLTEADRQARRPPGNAFLVIGRLRPGASIETAQAALSTLMARARRDYPRELAQTEVFVTPASERFVRPVRPALYALSGGVALLLFIACGNVANLLLVRAVSRRQEIGVRRALGASGVDLVRIGLAESLAPGLLGSILGLAFGWMGVEATLAVIPISPGLPRPQLELEWSAAAFAVGLALVTTLVCGIVPSLAATRVAAAEAIAGGSKGAGVDAGRGKLKEGLVAAEIAMALVLLVTGALASRSVANLEALDAGFDAKANALTFRVSTRGAAYASPEARVRLFTRALEEFRGIPGVEAAGASLNQPFVALGAFQTYAVAGAPPPPEGREPRAIVRPTLPGFFATYGTSLVAGRDLADTDSASSEPVAVINETLARRAFGESDPLRGSIVTRDGRTRRVVGVVEDVRSSGESPLPAPGIFVPLSQDPSPNAMAYTLRTSAAPMEILPLVQDRMRRVDPSLPVYFVQPLDGLIRALDAPARFLASLMAAFAALATALALAGSYVVSAYAAAQRRREFSLRVALGATPAHLARDVLRRASTVTLAGIAIGLVCAGFAGRALADRLFQVPAFDGPLFAGCAAAIALLMLASALAPAVRASKAEAARVLREG